MMGRSAAHRRPGSGVQHAHEWPLVVFTGLAIPAAGLSAARLLVESLGLLRGQAEDTVTEAGIALLVGLAVSLAHLGRVERAHLALKRFGRNALSTEVGLAIALVFAAGTAFVFPNIPFALRVFLVRASGVLGAGLLVALGLVYYLPARRPWRSPVVAAPLLSGLATGMVILAWEAPSPAATALAVLLLFADAVLCAPVWVKHRCADGFAPIHPVIFGRRTLLVSLRFAMFNAVPAAAIFRWPGVAVIAVLAGLLIDRLAFYGLATSRSTEAELAHVEKIILGAEP